MKAKGKCISALLIIDTFFISFAAGFNSRRVLVVDPSLPPLPVLVQPKDPARSANLTKIPAKEQKLEHSSGSYGSKSHHKKQVKAKTKASHGKP